APHLALGGDIAGGIVGEHVEAGFADLAGGKIDDPALDPEVPAEQVEIAADDLETAGQVRPGSVAGDSDLPAPFAVEAMTAHEGLPGNGDLHVERHRQG